MVSHDVETSAEATCQIIQRHTHGCLPTVYGNRTIWPDQVKPSKLWETWPARHYFHIKIGKPTYIVVWEQRKNEIKLVEVPYVETHGGAPYLSC